MFLFWLTDVKFTDIFWPSYLLIPYKVYATPFGFAVHIPHVFGKTPSADDQREAGYAAEAGETLPAEEDSNKSVQESAATSFAEPNGKYLVFIVYCDAVKPTVLFSCRTSLQFMFVNPTSVLLESALNRQDSASCCPTTQVYA